MDFFVEAIPYIGGIIGLLIAFLLGKWGFNINKKATINGCITVMEKLSEIFGWVEKDSEKSGIKNTAKLNLALDIAKNKLNKDELKVITNIGKIAEKNPKKPTFGDNLKAGVQDVFINSVSMLAKDKLGKLIKKI